MKICIIFRVSPVIPVTLHSIWHSRAMLISLKSVTGRLMKLTRFLVWCRKARGEEKTEKEPAAVDVSEYNVLVFGSPMWAFKPTLVIHTAIASLKECEGKKAVAFSTHGGRPGQTDEIFINGSNPVA